MKERNVKKALLAFILAGAVTMAGCSGDDGKDGAPGAPGQPGGTVVDVTQQTPETLAAMTLNAEVTGVTINSPPVVNFRVLDGNGRGIVKLSTSNLRFIIAKLVPGTGGNPDTWQSYINTTEEPATKKSGGVANNVGPGGVPALSKVVQATTESNGTLVDNGDGTYTYTFATDVTTVTDPVTGSVIGYDPSMTHRVAIQLSGDSLPVKNVIYDFVPAGGEVSTKREVAMTASCNECHDELAIHGGGRVEMKYCVTCHNPGTVDANSGNNLDMAEMVHKIHRGAHLPSVEAGGEYAIWGYRASKHDYSEVGYPQDITNCRKCHSAGDSATPQGDNWKNKPSIQSCGSCHDDVDFATGAGHVAGAQANNSRCSGCHTAADIEEKHLTDNATTNNPNVPTGAVNFEYQIDTVTVSSSDQPVVKFRILANGTPVVFNTSGSILLTGYTGSPSFLVAYAQTQDGITAPADYNNLGKSAAQPASVSILNVMNGTQGTLAGPDQNGYYTATLNGPSTTNAARFPAGATLRAVALQGYFTQSAGTNGLAAATARHAISVIKNVSTDSARRTVVDSAKCANCHEWFEAHGGNRVYDVQVCVTCHVPNLSTSGRGASTANIDTANRALLTADGYDFNAPTTFPENSNNLKDLIHGIHASQARTTDFNFVRDRGTSGVYYYNWSHVTYPTAVNNCAMCHIDDNPVTSANEATYDIDLPAGVLATTVESKNSSGVFTKTVPNATDLVSTPAASTCVYCHDSALSKTHMAQNGGQINVARSTLNATGETCVLCHGPGRSADVKAVHK